jgi:molybdenum cofactor guanylyltransferase
LAGLYRGLCIVEQMQECDYLITVPCDSPFLPLDLVSRLAYASVKHDASVAVAKTGDQVHPVFMLVKRSALSNLEAFLKAGGRKIDTWYASLPFVEVPFEQARAFDNVNTLDDLTHANSDDRLSSR